jgi:methionine-S-sulfoxide reductase
LPGVVRTRVGYAGDPAKTHPTYHDLGFHAETLQLDYDPARISYEELLALFWNEHNPFRSAWMPQYRSAVFFHDEEQERLVRESVVRLEKASGRQVRTEVLPADTFWPAEDYHQKYRLQRRRELVGEYAHIYPDFADFVASTAVARVNGFLDGYGSPAQLEEELPLLGLSDESRLRLQGSVRFRRSA